MAAGARRASANTRASDHGNGAIASHLHTTCAVQNGEWFSLEMGRLEMTAREGGMVSIALVSMAGLKLAEVLSTGAQNPREETDAS